MPVVSARSLPAPRLRPVAPKEPYAPGMPPLDPQSVRPFRRLDRPAAQLFTAGESAQDSAQSVDAFLASLPELNPPADGENGPSGQQRQDR